MIPNSHIVILAAILFAIGATGMLLRRNAIMMLMSVELMLNAANVAIVAFARMRSDITGQVYVLFIMTVAAAEVAIGLALLLAINRTRRTLDTDQVDTLRW
jgi:NADH-quinone oxidoreductase subunit K